MRECALRTAVVEQMPDHPRRSPEAKAWLGPDPERFIGFVTVFYIYGGSILVGGLRALQQEPPN